MQGTSAWHCYRPTAERYTPPHGSWMTTEHAGFPRGDPLSRNGRRIHRNLENGWSCSPVRSTAGNHRYCVPHRTGCAGLIKKTENDISHSYCSIRPLPWVQTATPRCCGHPRAGIYRSRLMSDPAVGRERIPGDSAGGGPARRGLHPRLPPQERSGYPGDLFLPVFPVRITPSITV